MKNIVSGILGGLIVWLGLTFLSPKNNVVSPSGVEPTNVRYVAHEAPALPVTFDFSEAAKKAMPAVVHISAKSAKRTASRDPQSFYNPFRFFFGDDMESFNMPKQGTGSGVIYSKDGYIITNNHVVGFADDIQVTLYDNRKFNAKIVGTDKKSDLAVIKIEASDLPILDLSDSDRAEVGQWVLAVGNPFDLTSTVTAGIISAKGRNIRLLGGGDAIEAFIQTDAAVNPGNSGGALVDSEGRLLGINTAIATPNGVFSGYSFAIPVSLVQRIVDDIIDYGSYQRPYLGVEIAELDSDYAAELGVKTSQGVVIENLTDGGSAQYGGLQPKDVIVKANGKDIKSVAELQEVVGRARVGETIALTVYRKGKERDFNIALKPQK
jgi:serine protease Do